MIGDYYQPLWYDAGTYFITSHIYRVIITSKILGAERNITKEANRYVEGSAQINSCSDHTIHLVQGRIR